MGTATSQSVIELVDAILSEKSGLGLEIIHKALDSGTDPRQYARQVGYYLRDLLVIKMQAGKDLELTPEDRKTMEGQAKKFETSHLVSIISTFSEASTDLKANWHPGLGLELALASSLFQPQPVLQVMQETERPAPRSYEEEASRKASAVSQTESDQKETSDKNYEMIEVPSTFDSRQPLTLELALSQWEKVKQAVGKHNRITAAVLNSGKVVQALGDTIVLNFQRELLRERISEEKVNKLVLHMLKKVYGREITLICTVGDKRKVIPSLHDENEEDLVEFVVEKLNGVLLESDPTEERKEE